jgi:hypothetical protein
MADKTAKTTSMRIGSDVTKQAKIAAAFKGLTVLDYVSQVVLAAAARDIEESYRAGAAPAPTKKSRSQTRENGS